jgi:putative addiction module component (TIGR02574 family)
VASRLRIPPPGFDDLTPEEKVRYVGALWDRIVTQHNRLPISGAQWSLIRLRIAAHEANPSAVPRWSEIRREVEQATSGDGKFHSYLRWWQEYFEHLGMRAEAKSLVPAVDLAVAAEPTQALFDCALAAIASCPEGSPICGIWRDLRAWGERCGFITPPDSSFPWK